VAVTRSSVERLGLHQGSNAAAYVKATEPVLSA
jgi:molybdopterin-binding protein